MVHFEQALISALETETPHTILKDVTFTLVSLFVVIYRRLAWCMDIEMTKDYSNCFEK